MVAVFLERVDISLWRLLLQQKKVSVPRLAGISRSIETPSSNVRLVWRDRHEYKRIQSEGYVLGKFTEGVCTTL